MENKVKQICSWINDIAKLSKTIEQNKMSSAELKTLLEIVDVKKKGFLDLNDVYELAGKVSENQLFAIFKFMDTQRTGEIRFQQLETAFGNQSSSKNITKEYIFPRFYAIIDLIKDKTRLANEYKKKYGFTSANLKQTYQYISNSFQSKYLTCQELITALKDQSNNCGVKWGADQQNVVKELLPDRNVSESRFVQLLNIQAKPKVELEEECLLSGISSQKFSASKGKSSHTKVSSTTLNKSGYEKQVNPSMISKKTNNYFEKSSNQSSPFQAKGRENFQVEQKEGDRAYSKKFEAIQGNINEVLGSIQQRKQKLRQDSLERKKLIQDVMNRKRQFCASSNIPSSPQSNTWKIGQQFLRKREQEEKESSKSYINKSYQKGTTSSYKQTYHYQNQLIKNSQRTPQFVSVSVAETPQFQENIHIARGKSSINDLKLSLQNQLNKSLKKESRPFTPSNLQSKNEINELLKKYNNLSSSSYKYKQQVQEKTTLKELSKSKSGLIYSQPYQNYQKSYPNPHDIYESNQTKYQRQSLNLKPSMSKQNILKRAEEQANRKIEEIQRKARMKVLEKKGMSRGNKQEWSKLIKRGCYY